MKKIIVGISGASGAIYGIRLLEALREAEVQTHLIISKAGKITLEHETNFKLDDIIKKASYYHNNNDITASIASGSFLIDGMVILPCTVRTLSEIAYSTGSSLIARAADVTLKDRRRLILGLRESPLHLGHIRSMLTVTEMGGIILPLVSTFYNQPKTIDDMINHTVGRICDLIGIVTPIVKRWKGLNSTES